MAVHKFDNLEEFQAFINQATADDVRPLIRHDLQVEVPDDYTPSSKVDQGEDVDSPFATEEETEAAAQAQANEVVEAYERNTAEATQEQVTPLERPSKSARRDEWVAYAESLGLDPGDKTRDAIIKEVEGA